VAVIAGDGSILQNCTFAANAGSDVGGVTILAPSVFISGCTFYDNDWAQLHATNNQPTLANSLIAGECSSSTAVVSVGGNLESPGNSCGFGASDIVNVVDPMLGTLGWFGNVAPVIRPLPGSPAIDRSVAEPNCPWYDQRFLWRPQDGNGDGQAVCDIGAVELAAGGEILIETFDSGFTTSWSQVVP
jgi:hypothetical protein